MNKLIIIMVLCGILYYYIAEWFTWRSPFINKLRNKYKFLKNKPWSCTKCIATWLMIFTLYYFSENNIYWYLINIVIAFMYFCMVKFFSEYRQPKILLLSEDKNSKYEYITSEFLDINADEKYKLIIKVDGREIVNSDFNSDNDRIEYINDWNIIFKK